MGEVHPEVLEAYKLVQPCALFEVDLSLLTNGAAAAASGPFATLSCGAAG
jgi:phenylalanyl-tRNA synthetase beta subunit